MLKPFYQGKLDSFCAIYAVLNALRLLHGIRSNRAREILNESLLALAEKPKAFRAFLEQETDYIALVDSLLAFVATRHPLSYSRPFALPEAKLRQDPACPVPLLNPDPAQFLECCQNWLCRPGRTIILRFLRYITPESGPVNRHWTCVDKMDKRTLHLFDCSHEAESIQNIASSGFVTSEKAVSREALLCIQPESVRFLRLPF